MLTGNATSRENSILGQQNIGQNLYSTLASPTLIEGRRIESNMHIKDAIFPEKMNSFRSSLQDKSSSNPQQLHSSAITQSQYSSVQGKNSGISS